MSFLSVDKTLAKAKSYAKRGEIQEARKSCEMLLKSFPKNIRIRQFIASLENTKSLNEISQTLVDLYNLAKYEEIIRQSEQYLNFHPRSCFVWNMYGAACEELKNIDEAIKAYKKAIFLDPNNHEYYNNLGNAFEKKEDFLKSINYYKKSLNLKPNYVQALFNLGNVLKKNGQKDQAINAFNKTLLINPNYVEALNNMGNLLIEENRIDEAMDMLTRALNIDPKCSKIYANLASVFNHTGKLDKAINAYQKALSLNPKDAATLNSLGNCFKEQNKPFKAIEMYNKALLFDPDFEMARAQKLFILSCICDWDAIEQDHSFVSSLGINKKLVPPFALLSLEDNPENQKKRAETFSKLNFLQKPIQFKTSPVITKKRIRIGYFSADYHNHATMHLMSKVFTLHDRDKFEIYAYSYGPQKDDNMRQNLISSVDVFDDVSQMSDKDVALLARQDEIDIAIDLKGYTHNSRSSIFGYRAAPIQINFLGYPGTMGAEFIDYIIADKTIIPEELIDHYSEEIIYMPNSYQPNNNQRPISRREISKSDMGLPEDGFIFCSFNNNYKITPKEFDTWMRILKKVEGSVLWLLKSNKWAEANLKREAENRGVDSDRLIFAKKMSIEEHLARHKLADLFLDTFNVNAHTTASDALWAGLPVVTKLGKSFVSRVAGSLLKAIGLPELVTENEKDYESLIIDLALNPDKLLKIKEKLLINRISQPLFDSEMYTRHLENGFKQAYEHHINGIMPKTIIIDS